MAVSGADTHYKGLVWRTPARVPILRPAERPASEINEDLCMDREYDSPDVRTDRPGVGQPGSGPDAGRGGAPGANDPRIPCPAVDRGADAFPAQSLPPVVDSLGEGAGELLGVLSLCLCMDYAPCMRGLWMG